jgi:hypothetical protein
MTYEELSKEEKLLIRQHRRMRAKHPRRWVYGIDMPQFSGKSWKDLQDVWPIELRTSSEAYYILCAFLPAWEKLKFFAAQLLGLETNKADLRFHDIGMLAWCSRCEEANEGLMADYLVAKLALMAGNNKKLFAVRKSILVKHNLLENIPNGPDHKLPVFYCFRVTEKGRILLRKFIEFVDESHDLIKSTPRIDKPGNDKWMKKNFE